MNGVRLVAGIAAGIITGTISALFMFLGLGLSIAVCVFGERGAGAFQQYVLPLLLLSTICGARIGIGVCRLIVRASIKPVTKADSD